MAKPLILLAMLTACTPHPGPAREVVVVARGMTFVLEGEPDVPNPVIRLRAGERVRLVLRNEAPGLLHDLEIPEWDVAIEQMRAGERRDVTFTVPDAPGRYEYRSRPHSGRMHSFVEVVP